MAEGVLDLVSQLPTTLYFRSESFGKRARLKKRGREGTHEEASQAFGSGGDGLLVAAMMAASAPPAFAEDGGCENGQNQAFVNAGLKLDNEEQAVKHLYKFVYCEIDQPPGEGQ